LDDVIARSFFSVLLLQLCLPPPQCEDQTILSETQDRICI
jgi:hypothetical protein